MYHGRKFDNVEQLKQAILLEWRALLQRFIDGSINQWRRRLLGVVQENGGHIEHVVQLAVDTIRYYSVYLTCSKKLTGSQLSLPQGSRNKQKIKM